VVVSIVRDIFHWFVLDDMSKRGIALKLNELRVPNLTAYKQQIQKLKYQNPGARQNDGLWSASNVLSILKIRCTLAAWCKNDME